MALLETRGVVKSFNQGDIKVEVLKGIDLKVEKGEFVCIMGASGSGKTTLLQLLGGLDQATRGSVIIDGTDLSILKENKLAIFRREKIGFVFQQFNLIPVLTAEENVALPLLIGKKPDKQAKQRAKDLLKLVGLGDRSKHRPAQLSGGQQQRVAIARALSTEPSILLADEPTGALDSRSSQEIIQLLRKTCDELGQTTIVVTHDPFVAAHADRVVVLVDGKVADNFRIEGHWMSRDVKEQIYQIQVRLNAHFAQKERKAL
jgi:putative ABC transport system ATP-binding protein